MKKRIFLVTALVLLVLASGFTEGTTWTNPDEVMYFGDASNASITLPRSMISAVSNGIFYDEIDTLILSPGELSNYSGYSIITGYGNYEYDYEVATDYSNAWVNPFGTTVLTQGSAGNIGNFLLGATGDIFDFRGGVIASFEFSNTMRLDTDGAGALAATWSEEQSETVDADGDGTADYTYSNVQNFTDYNAITEINLGAGVDLGFMGTSLYASYLQTNNHFGGSFTYTKGKNADTDAAASADISDFVTSRVNTYGYGEDGKAKNNPMTSTTDMILGARAHFPLELMDTSVPVKGEIYFGSETPTVSSLSGNSLFPQYTSSITASNVGGVEDDTSTITVLAGESEIDATFDFNTSTTGTGDGITEAYAPADFSSLITAVEGAGTSFAYDPDNSSNFNFKTGVKGLIDPEIVMNDVFSIRTRGQVGYELDMTSATVSEQKTLTYNQAIAGQTSPGVYSYSETYSAATSTAVNTIGLELGGLMDLHNSEKTLSVAAGLFYTPAFAFTGVKTKDDVHTTVRSWNDPSGANDVTAVGDTVAFEGLEGTETTTVTTLYADDKSSSEFEMTNSFYIPVAARVVFAGGKLELVNGYLLKHDTTYTSTTTYAVSSASGSVTTLTDTAGTEFNADADTSVASNSTATTESVLANNGWTGNMSFMLRWNAMDGVTVDFYGDTIMTALSFNILGGGIGFNPSTFINALGMSVTISM